MTACAVKSPTELADLSLAQGAAVETNVGHRTGETFVNPAADGERGIRRQVEVAGRERARLGDPPAVQVEQEAPAFFDGGDVVPARREVAVPSRDLASLDRLNVARRESAGKEAAV